MVELGCYYGLQSGGSHLWWDLKIANRENGSMEMGDFL